MVLVSHGAVPPSRVLQGSLVLVVLLLLGPLIAWKVFLLLWPARWVMLATLALVETCFYRFWYLPTYQQHSRIPDPCRPPGFTDADGRRLWRRFMAVTQALPNGINPKEYLQQWFCDAPFDQIHQENVREMLTYGFFYKRREDLSPDMQLFTKQMVRDLEAALKMQFAPGYTPGLRFMSHLWEDLRAHYRPFVMYAFFECLYLAQRLIMAGYGFQHRTLGHLGYYTLGCGLDADAYSKHSNGSSSSRRSKLDKLFDKLQKQLAPEPFVPALQPDSDVSEDYTPFADPMSLMGEGDTTIPTTPKNPLEDALPQGDTPVMFLHGVGGLMLYLEMLKHVIGLGHPVIVVEYKHVGLRLSTTIPDVDMLTRNVVDILEFEQIPKVCVVGHSYGSFVASRLNMSYRDRVHSMCVIDPVALGMFMPHLLHNFMYRRPRVDLKRPDILLRDVVLWFASRDVHLSATFSRNFYWTEMNMWPEDLPPGSCVILSGNDDLCNAEGVESMCKLAPDIKVIVNHELFHGAFLLSTAHKANLMAEVRHLLATTGSMVVHMAQPVLAHTLTAAHSLLHGVETLTSRLSMSPQPFGAGNRRAAEPRAATPGIWKTMSELAASVKQRGSVPAPTHPAGDSSSSALHPPTRSPSAPLVVATAAAAVAAAGLAVTSPRAAGDMGSPGSNAAADTAATAATAAAAEARDAHGSGSSSSSTSPRLAPAAGWWGPAAVAAMAAMEQQPAAAMAAMGQEQQQPQLSVILSGPEGTLANGELGQIGGSSSVKSASGQSGPPGPPGPSDEGFVEDGSWVLTDAGTSGHDGFGARQGSDQGTGFGTQQLHTVLGAIKEDSQEMPKLNKQQQQQQQAVKAGAAAATVGQAVGGSKTAAAEAPAGAGDAAAQEDQAS